LNGSRIVSRARGSIGSRTTSRSSEGAATHFEWLTLVSRLEAGDAAALRRISSVVHGFLARYGAYRLRDSWDDIAQEAVISLIRAVRRGQLRDPRAFVTYLGSITRNKLSDWLRRENRSGALAAKPEPRLGGGEPQIFLDRPRHDPRTQDLDFLLDLEAALASLPSRQRNVLDCVYLQGHTYTDASNRLDLPLGTLKRMQTQGLRNLRTSLNVTVQ